MDGKSMGAATGTQKKYYRLATKHHLSCLDFLLQTETGQGLSQFVPADRLEALKKAPLDLVCFSCCLGASHILELGSKGSFIVHMWRQRKMPRVMTW